MAKQTFTAGQVLTATQVNALQANDYNQTVSTKTGSYTLVAADVGTRIAMNSASATTITVNTSLFSAGDTLFISNISTGACTITPGTATVACAGSLIVPADGGGMLYFTSTGVATYYPDNPSSGYQTYTPIFAGVTVGNGTRAFRYTQIGKFVHYQGSFTFGTTSSIAGTCAIYLPVAPKTEGWSCCVTQLQDTGVSTLMGSGNIIGNYVYVYVNSASGTYVTPNGLTTTVPFTWGNTDQITLDMVYEAA